MKVHEFQAKQIFKEYGVPIPDGGVANTVPEAVAIAEKLGYPCVIKAQVHAGGRGKAGGVKLAKTLQEAETHAGDIIGMKLVSKQTGPEGKLVRKVLVEQVAVTHLPPGPHLRCIPHFDPPVVCDTNRYAVPVRCRRGRVRCLFGRASTGGTRQG